METALRPTITPTVRSGGIYSWLAGVIRAHPILLLIVFSPGIPEYLSGNSYQASMLANPVGFIIFVLLNIGLYTNGVILIREAVLRWKKSWASIFVLGIAYGIVEEGIAVQTLFDSNAPPVGQLGFYGHWLGVNWVWTAAILLFHSTISVGLPILLLGLALPSQRPKSLVTIGQQKICFVLMSVDVFILFLIVHYWPGWAIMLGSFFSVFALIILAKKLPASLGRPLAVRSIGTRKLTLLGVLFFPAFLLTGGISAGLGLPPIVPIVLYIVYTAVLVLFLRGSVTPSKNEMQKVALASGLVLPIIFFGFIGTSGVTVGLDVGFLLFMRHVWRRYRPAKPSAQLSGFVASSFPAASQETA